jgi:hypothetical protein
LKRTQKKKPSRITTQSRSPKAKRSCLPWFRFVLSWLGAVLDLRGRGLTTPAMVVFGIVAVCLTLAFARATSFH